MDHISKLFASLDALGLSPKMETFSERKRVQKVVYLLDKVFGMNLDFSYSWYLHGPYSPQLTRIVFDVIEGQTVVDSNLKVLSSNDQRKIEELKAFLGNDINSSDKLELLVSLHFLLNRMKDSDVSQEDIIAFLRRKKPYFTDEEIIGAIDQLQTLGSL